LEDSSAIQAAATIAVDDPRGNKILVAYATTCKAIEVDEIRSHLADRLPDYMLPAEIFLLPEMPLNNSGKINKLALKQQYQTKGATGCPTHCPA
jgi:acyl-coenzyme A synthetase/AMP-(fatty) acid ligase